MGMCVLWAAILAPARWPIVGCLSHRGVSILCRRRRLQSLPDLNLCKVGAATSVSQMVSLGPKGLVTAQGH